MAKNPKQQIVINVKHVGSLKNTGIKYDQNKPMWWLLPMEAVNEVVKVLTFGANKYGPENWHMLTDLRKRYLSACMRHIAAFRCGERNDKETGIHHLAHAICCLLFVLWAELTGKKE